MTIQRFFIRYVDIIFHNQIEGIKFIFRIEINDNDNYSEPAVAQKLISEFVKTQIKELDLGEVIDTDNVSSSLLMYYLDNIYEIYVGIIDERKHKIKEKEVGK